MFENIKSEVNAIEVQNELNKLIVLNNNFDYQDLSRVAGVDLAYWYESGIEYVVL